MADIKAIAEELVNLTVKEVQELKTILKDEYGIEPAAAAVAVAAGPAAGGAEAAAEEKTSFDVVLKEIGGAKLQVEEARTLARAYGNDGLACLQPRLALVGSTGGHDCIEVGTEHIGCYLVCQFRISDSNAILVQLHFYSSFLAAPVEPIGMVGRGDPQEVTPVRIVLCMGGGETEKKEEKGEEVAPPDLPEREEMAGA